MKGNSGQSADERSMFSWAKGASCLMEFVSWYALILVRMTCIRGRGSKAARHCRTVFASCLIQWRRQSSHCCPRSSVG